MKDEASSAIGVPDGLPVDTLRDAAPFLRRPFTPEAVKFKVQTVFKEAKGCLIVGYIDARLVIERFNAVIPDKWSAVYVPVDGTKLLQCHLTVDGVTRVDVGESPKGQSKDLYSDALKRAAVHFGVGVSIYAVPQITTFFDASGKLEKRQGPKGPTLSLTKEGHAVLREGYATWLENVGEPRFGKPLDHGDSEGGEFDPSAEADGPEFAPAPAAPLEDDRAVKLTEACKAAYDRLRAVDPKAVPPGVFAGWLAGAAHSHEELERLAAHLEKRVAEVAA